MFKQADLKTAEWNKFYASFLTEVSTGGPSQNSAHRQLTVDEEHFHRGTEEIREKGPRPVGDSEPRRKPIGRRQPEEADPTSDKTETENVRLPTPSLRRHRRRFRKSALIDWRECRITL